MSNLLGPHTSSQKRGISIVLIFALMPTAARFAWMIGAIATIAGNEEAMVMRGLETVRVARLGQQRLARAISAPALKKWMSA